VINGLRSRGAWMVVAGGLSLPACVAGVAGLALPSPVLAQPESRKPGEEAGAALPIRGITLYRSGVGYFERRGMVDGSEKVQLRFATDQINDIIKSMVILDRGGGRIDGVSYGSKEPLERRLSSFGIDLSDNPTLGTLLARLRGAPVRFTMTEGTTVEGMIIGGETRPEASGQLDNPMQVPYVNVLTSEGVRSVNLTTIKAVDILDPQLKEELNKALSALSEHRADRVKTVDISFAGEGAREAVVAYVHEMPVWKTSYRLVLPELGDAKGAKEGQPMVQGWAIVENTTDEDWEGVRLALVAGRPVSFRMDLYEPLFTFRPEIPVPMVAGVLPKIYQAGAEFEAKAALGEMARNAPAAPAATAPAEPMMERRMRRELEAYSGAVAGKPARDEGGAPMSAEDLGRYTAQSQAQAGEIGEVFQYQLSAPVSIARQRSAMLPILNANTEGRRVSIYNRADSADHPMRGVEIKNTTGLQLMPGPMSVFDGAAYAGDAQIGHITTGDKRLLSYAVDLDVMVVTKDESRSDVGKIKIVSGLIHQTSKHVSRIGYAFQNKDQKRPRLILVEHPKNGGWDLVEPKKPAEETQQLYRFELPLEAAASGSLNVVQERTDTERIAVTSYDLGTLLAFQQQGKVSKAVVDAVKKAADMQAAINDTQRRIQVLEQERSAIHEDQTRIRQNMEPIAKDSDLYRRYMTKFNEQETRLEAILTERQKEQDKLQAQQKELQDYVRGLNVE
jgi:hypothetical protein